jgi:hypothetical protein
MGMAVQEDYFIKRPVEDVFVFVGNMENSPLWGRTIKTTKVSDGPISIGTEFCEEVKLMGRKMTSLAEVTEYDLPTRFSHVGRFDSMVERASYTFEPEGEGTRVSLKWGDWESCWHPYSPGSCAETFSRCSKASRMCLRRSVELATRKS